MTKERFVEIFLEEGNDEEWAETCWNLAEKSDDIGFLTEEIVRQAARAWTTYAEDGGY